MNAARLLWHGMTDAFRLAADLLQCDWRAVLRWIGGADRWPNSSPHDRWVKDDLTGDKQNVDNT